MKKRIVIVSCIIVLIIIGVLFALYKINNHKTLEFKDLIKFKTESVMNEKQLSKILDNLELGQYIINTEKESIDGKDKLTVYFDCTDENEIMNYYRTYHKLSPIEKNAVTLFALVNKLDEITMNFTVSNIQFAKEHHLGVIEDKYYATEYTYTREMIEEHYNQDVRNYIENPEEFMKYNIDLNVNEATIYYRDYNNPEKFNEINVINIQEKNVINNIVNYIKEQNFNVPDGGYDGICNIWLDLNDGYIIGVYGEGYNNYGEIIKGNGKEIFESEKLEIPNYVYKNLPEGLSEYIEKYIAEHQS